MLVQSPGYLVSYRTGHLPRVLHRIREHGRNATVLHLRSRRAARGLLTDTRHRRGLGGGR
jgi:hypothetical protein